MHRTDTVVGVQVEPVALVVEILALLLAMEVCNDLHTGLFAIQVLVVLAGVCLEWQGADC